MVYNNIIIRRQRNKQGKVIYSEVNLLSKPITLELIRSKFGVRGRDQAEEVEFSMNDYLEKVLRGRIFDFNKIAKHKQRIIRLRNSGWLKKNKNKTFSPTSKFKRYITEWGCCDNPNSQLMRRSARNIDKT